MTKYILSYALMALFIGLGTYILCRPSRRFEGDREPPVFTGLGSPGSVAQRPAG